MEYPDFIKHLKTLDIEVATTAFAGENEGVTLPALIVLDTAETDGADDAIFSIKHNVTLDLFTSTGDGSAVKKLDALLIKNNINFKRSQEFYFNENYFLTEYELGEFFIEELED